MIYYVEDDDNIRELVVYTLTQMSLPCRGFADGAAFRAAVAEATPDLVLLDIMLPGEDGLSLLRFLREEGCDAPVEGYPVLLRELFHNLIDNAVKYTPAGGSVTVWLARREGRVCCTVEDTGIGIPPEHQAHVFERFCRVDKSHSRQTGGTGLGLAIVKHVAEVHQAEVQLDSTPQEGTRVTVCF